MVIYRWYKGMGYLSVYRTHETISDAYASQTIFKSIENMFSSVAIQVRNSWANSCMCVTIHVKVIDILQPRYWEDSISRTKAASKVTEFDWGIILGSMAPLIPWKIKTSSDNNTVAPMYGTHLIHDRRSDLHSFFGLFRSSGLFPVNWMNNQFFICVKYQRTRASMPLAAWDLWIMNSTHKSLEPAANSPVWHRSVLGQQSAVAAKHTKAATQSRALWATGANLCQPCRNRETSLDFQHHTTHSCW